MQNFVMKHLFFLCACLFGFLGGFAQGWGWSDPVALTDSLHNNTNLSVQVGDPMAFPDSVFAVWELSTDALSTAIYARNLTSMADPFPLLSQQGVHFRNPKRVPVWDAYIQFYFFYETDINGNRDICYISYNTDGTISDPVPVCTTQTDERNFQYSEGNVAWQRDDEIVTQEYSIWGGFPPGSQPEVLDAGECRNPTFSGFYCSWEKVVNNVSQAWFASREYILGQWVWSQPVLIDSTNNNNHLFLDGFLCPSFLTWHCPFGNLIRFPTHS